MHLNRVDLNLLVALDVLLQERNVTRAADRLSLGQPAMSATLARLRKLFDDPLLVRRGRVLEPTPLAQSLVQPVAHALAGIQDVLTTKPGFDPGADERTFAVMASDYVTLMLIRPLLAELHQVAPKVRVTVNPVTSRYRDDLERGALDLLLLPLEVDSGLGRFPHQTAFQDRYVCAVWKEHPDVGEEMTLELLARLPYLVYDSLVLPNNVETQFDALGITRNVEVATGTFLLSALLLQGTRLVAMLHERMARELEHVAALRILDPPVPLTPITEMMFWHPRSDADPGHRWLRERIAALAADL